MSSQVVSSMQACPPNTSSTAPCAGATPSGNTECNTSFDVGSRSRIASADSTPREYNSLLHATPVVMLTREASGSSRISSRGSYADLRTDLCSLGDPVEYHSGDFVGSTPLREVSGNQRSTAPSAIPGYRTKPPAGLRKLPTAQRARNEAPQLAGRSPAFFAGRAAARKLQPMARHLLQHQGRATSERSCASRDVIADDCSSVAAVSPSRRASRQPLQSSASIAATPLRAWRPGMQRGEPAPTAAATPLRASQRQQHLGSRPGSVVGSPSYSEFSMAMTHSAAASASRQNSLRARYCGTSPGAASTAGSADIRKVRRSCRSARACSEIALPASALTSVCNSSTANTLPSIDKYHLSWVLHLFGTCHVEQPKENGPSVGSADAESSVPEAGADREAKQALGALPEDVHAASHSAAS